jgi:GNAT superfamily N-acetyltransferase
MPSDAAYLYHFYVLQEERGNGIGAALASAGLRLAKDLGFRQTWQMIAPSNHASLRTLAKSGRDPRVVGELRFLQLLTRAYVRFTPALEPA